MITLRSERENLSRIIGELEGIAALDGNNTVSDMLFNIIRKLESILEPTEE